MILTTITAYWNRPDALRTWLRCIKAATLPSVQHLIYFVGEPVPSWWDEETKGTNIHALHQFEPPGLSIGHYHNLGAEQASTEWIMKLDIDSLPHTEYFSELLPVLQLASPGAWFNGGMFYLNKRFLMILPDKEPLSVKTYNTVMASPRTYSSSSYLLPAATNFICRRGTYLKLGGCDERFRGYGWEDYQQIYMLERYQFDKDPLPGVITLENVTRRCRDEISRPKAKQLYEWNNRLCLIHKWHPGSSDPVYKSTMDGNRKILLEWIENVRTLDFMAR